MWNAMKAFERSIPVTVFFWFLLLSKYYLHFSSSRGVFTNNGLKGAGSNRDLFCIAYTNMVEKSIILLHLVNNIENNIKQHIYTDMEVISLIAPWYRI